MISLAQEIFVVLLLLWWWWWWRHLLLTISSVIALKTYLVLSMKDCQIKDFGWWIQEQSWDNVIKAHSVLDKTEYAVTGVALGFKIRGHGWPLKQPEIKNRESKCNLCGSLPAEKLPKVKKEWVMNDSQKPPEIQNWGSFFAKCASMTPCPPLVQSMCSHKFVFSHSRRLKVSDHRKIKCDLFLSLYPHTWIWITKYFYQSIGSLHGSAIWGELWSGAPQCMHKLLDAIACPHVSTHYTRANQVHYYASFILQIEALPTHCGSCKEQIRS